MLPLQCGCGWIVRTFQEPDHHQTAIAAEEAQTQFNYYFIINILHIRNASAAAAQVRASEEHSLYGLSTRNQEEHQGQGKKWSTSVLRVVQKKKKEMLRKYEKLGKKM